MRVIHIILACWLLMMVGNNCSGKGGEDYPLKSRERMLNAYSASQQVRSQLTICRIVRSLFVLALSMR